MTMNRKIGQSLLLLAIAVVFGAGCFYIEPPISDYDTGDYDYEAEPCSAEEESAARCIEEVLERCTDGYWLVEEDCEEYDETCYAEEDGSEGNCQ